MEPTTDRAQVESLGSLLLVAVVVISAGTFGAYYLASATGGSAGGAAGGADSIDLAVGATQDELRLSHNGGASVPASDLQLTVENASGEYTFAFDEGTIRGGDGDNRFDAGETWRLAWDQSPDTQVTISLVDTDADRLLFRGSATVGSPATDSVRAVGENVSTDSVSDDPEEGEDADGPSEPWLDVDDDGRFEEEDGDVTVDLSGGEIPDEHKDGDATLRVPADVTVDTGSDQLDIDGVDRIRIAGTVRSDKKIDLAAESISLDDGRLDNTEGSLQLIVDSKTSLTADGAVLASANIIELRSNEAMSVDNAEVDNTAGDKNLKLDSEAGLTADSSTLTSAGKIEILSKNDMSVQRAAVDNSGGDNVDIFVESKSDLNVDNTVFTASDEITLKSSGEKSTQNTEQNENEG